MASKTDQYMQRIAESLHAQSGQISQQILRNAIESVWPKLWSQFCLAKEGNELFDLWGHSFNFDENAELRIVPQRILQALCRLFKEPRPAGEYQPSGKKIYNAGLLHLYGYLFSLIQTPYGLKRTRWVSPTICNGFGLRRNELRIDCSSGTLIGNLTYFLSRAISANKISNRFSNWIDSQIISQSLVDYPYDSLKIERIIVKTKVESRGGAESKIAILYDLVEFPKSVNKDLNHLLIYRVGKNPSTARLVTTFPAGPSTCNEILSLPEISQKRSHELRFNATYLEF